ncbi:MAG: hydroxymethylbilane synthase [Vulcanimicrobiaceae bacterium]
MNLPISLRLTGRRVVVVGGGEVALRKVGALLDARACLRLVAPTIGPALRALLLQSDAELRERAYELADLDGAFLVIVATNVEEVNARVSADARAAGILLIDASDAQRGDAAMLALHRDGDFTLAVDTNGAPAFAARVLRDLRPLLAQPYGAALGVYAKMRTYAKATLDNTERAAVLRTLAALPIDELSAMDFGEAEHAVDAAVSELRAELPVMTRRVVCATRGSALALTQSRTVAAVLAQYGLVTTLLEVRTTGDRVQDRPLASIGSQNVFVTELELALREGRADYAVHSCKDLPSDLPADMQIAAICARHDPRDLYCSERYSRFEELPAGARVGTSSPRRVAQLRALRADLQYLDLRGNVDTRLRKLRRGEYDAIVLAAAGLARLRLRATYLEPFALDQLVPAVGQGALALEVRSEDADLAARLRDAASDPDTERCVRAERAALRRLRAGCNAPVGIYACLDEEGMRITGVLAVPQGPTERAELCAAVASQEQAEALGTQLGALLADRLPLFGRRLALARSQERPSRIAGALRALGAEVLELTQAATSPLPGEPLPEMLLFPSSGSVAAVEPYLAHLRSVCARPLIGAMGPRTAEAAAAAGFAPDLVATQASNEAFVQAVHLHMLLRPPTSR